MTWGMAHARAMIRAAQAHRDLGLDPGAYIDVYEAIWRAGLVLFGSPMDELFGVYLPAVLGPGGQKAGVFLNTHRSPADQRHSAAHELGHHVFGHGECAADINQVFDHPTPRAWPVQEKEAEAFAAWFLMPLTATRNVINILGIERITCPDEAYQVALHLGASYRGTLRHLTSLKMITPDKAARWARVPRATMRQRAGSRAAAPANSVWVLGRAAHGATLHVSPGDQLVIDAPAAWNAAIPIALPPGVGLAPTTEDGALEFERAGPIEFNVTDEFMSAGPLRIEGSDQVGWQITLAPARNLQVGLNEPELM